MKEKVRPIIISNPETGEKYTLEFNRESVKYAEQQGFNIDDIANGKMMSGVGDLFFYAFRMHHRGIRRDKVDAILFDGMGGITEEMMGRLAELYAEPYNALIQDEDGRKNSKWAMEM